ncbi:MAG: protein kinase, partial [Polyangiaceae bacterium]|nr:protein kinase [Polyangiaceae bacterium]
GEKDTWEPGDLIAGRYQLDRMLGEGGMGIVWAATHVVTRKSVALKRLKPESVSEEQRRRFLREARVMSAVHHSHVAEIYDIFELDSGALIMVMELLEGESLADRLGREVMIPLHETVNILLPVLAAVGAAHRLGVVHRDLKPANIFLLKTSRERVKVLDFGIAKRMASEGAAEATTDLTESGTRLGTPCYMSPEQVFGEREIDHRADIWALGLILYECLAGALPTRAENVGQVFKRIVANPIPALRDVAPDVPEDVASIVTRMLSRARDDRPTDVEEVAQVLALHRRPPASSSRNSGLPASAPIGPQPQNQKIIVPSHADPLGPTERLEPAIGPELEGASPPKKEAIRHKRSLVALGVLVLAIALTFAALRGGASPQPELLAYSFAAPPPVARDEIAEIAPPLPEAEEPRRFPPAAERRVPTNYRGILRRLDNKAMMRGAEVLLIGTSCSRIVGHDGVFDFSDCDSEVVARIEAPRVRITLPNQGGFCTDIPLLIPPAITEISLNHRCSHTNNKMAGPRKPDKTKLVTGYCIRPANTPSIETKCEFIELSDKATLFSIPAPP